MACAQHPDRDSVARCVTCGAELCQECGKSVDGRFYCAAHVPAAPATAAAPPATAPPAPAAGGVLNDPAQDNPLLACLCYIVGIIIPIVVLVTDMKKSRYMRFHAFQSLFLAIAAFVVDIGLWILMAVLSAIKLGIVAMLLGLVLSLFGLVIFVLYIVLAIKAYNKQELELPVITKMAREQADKMRA